MNMLIGVLCEVVNAVASTEKEEMLVSYVNDKLQRVVKILDADGDNTISKKEFLQILENIDAVRCLQDVGVDVVGLVDYVDTIFEDDNALLDDTEEESNEGITLDFTKFMDVVLQLRGTNNATVKDIVDLRKFVRNAVFDMKKQLGCVLENVTATRLTLAPDTINLGRNTHVGPAPSYVSCKGGKGDDTQTRRVTTASVTMTTTDNYPAPTRPPGHRYTTHEDILRDSGVMANETYQVAVTSSRAHVREDPHLANSMWSKTAIDKVSDAKNETPLFQEMRDERYPVECGCLPLPPQASAVVTPSFLQPALSEEALQEVQAQIFEATAAPCAIVSQSLSQGTWYPFSTWEAQTMTVSPARPGSGPDFCEDAWGEPPNGGSDPRVDETAIGVGSSSSHVGPGAGRFPFPPENNYARDHHPSLVAEEARPEDTSSLHALGAPTSVGGSSVQNGVMQPECAGVLGARCTQL